MPTAQQQGFEFAVGNAGPGCGLTLVVIVATSLPKVPRAWIDYEGVPLLEHVHQPDLWGTDTIADSYEARVVLNDPLDMYTKRGVAQTPIGSRDVDEGTVGAPSSLARAGRAARE